MGPLLQRHCVALDPLNHLPTQKHPPTYSTPPPVPTTTTPSDPSDHLFRVFQFSRHIKVLLVKIRERISVLFSQSPPDVVLHLPKNMRCVVLSCVCGLTNVALLSGKMAAVQCGCFISQALG